MGTVKTYALSKDGTVKLSTHFRLREFACRDGSDTVLVDDALVDLLQQLRDHFGAAVTVTSGYRTPAYNAKVGGVSKSQHLLGTAADIIIAGVTPLEAAQYAEYLPQAYWIALWKTEYISHMLSACRQAVQMH